MDRLIPWDKCVEEIRPCYYKGERGNKPYGIELMLRPYVLQNLYSLSDEGTVAEAIDSRAASNFCGVDFSNQVPDGDTLGRFRNLLTRNGLQEKLFNQVVEMLEERGLILKKGTIVDSTIISAPSSTKNAEKKRDPEMHSTKKGNQWHFGMKCHTGVDAGSGFVHTVEATAANVHDVTVAAKLLREDDEVVYGDSAYLGVLSRDEVKQDPHLSAIEYRINRRPSRLPKVSDNAIDWERYIERRKSSVRCKVEHPYRIIKNIFGFRKTVYRGLQKNLNRLHVLFASANLYMLAKAGGSLRPAWDSCAL